VRLGKTACYLFELGERWPVFGVFWVAGIGQLGQQGVDFSANLIRIDIHCVPTLVTHQSLCTRDQRCSASRAQSSAASMRTGRQSN